MIKTQRFMLFWRKETQDNDLIQSIKPVDTLFKIS